MKEGLFAPAAGPFLNTLARKKRFLNARAVVNGNELKKFPEKKN